VKGNLICSGPFYREFPSYRCYAGHELSPSYEDVWVDLPAHAISIGPRSDPAIYAIHPESKDGVMLLRPINMPGTGMSGVFVWARYPSAHLSEAYRQQHIYGGTEFIELTRTEPNLPGRHAYDLRAGHGRDRYDYNRKSYLDYLADLKHRCIQQYNRPFTSDDIGLTLNDRYYTMFEPATYHTAYTTTTNSFKDLDGFDMGSTLLLESDTGLYSVYSQRYIPSTCLQR